MKRSTIRCSKNTSVGTSISSLICKVSPLASVALIDWMLHWPLNRNPHQPQSTYRCCAIPIIQPNAIYGLVGIQSFVKLASLSTQTKLAPAPWLGLHLQVLLSGDAEVLSDHGAVGSVRFAAFTHQAALEKPWQPWRIEIMTRKHPWEAAAPSTSTFSFKDFVLT